MKKRVNHHLSFFLITFLLPALGPGLVPSAQQDSEYDFAISKQFIQWLYDQRTVQPTLEIKLTDRTKQVHTLDNDCEIHIAGTFQAALGEPNDIVVEPPNLCKFPPPGQTASSESNLRKEIWPDYLDDHFMGKSCGVRGFFRIYTEHVQGSSDPANPNHVFEIHPAMYIKAGADEISFDSLLKAFNGMSHVKPETAASIIADKTLKVRYNTSTQQYEYLVQGKTGNFAIVEVGKINKDWIRSTGGGHSAIARVSPDGKSRMSLKLYTLSGTEADTWLQDIAQGKGSSRRILLHGLFTFDYFSIIKAIRTQEGVWSTDSGWKNVEYPMAFVVFGETDVIPWEED